MEFGAGRLTQPVEPVVITLNVGSGRCFFGESALQWGAFTDTTDEFDSFEQNIQIYLYKLARKGEKKRIAEHTSRVSEVVRVNDRVVQRVRRVDIDTAVAVRMLKGGSDADVAIGIAVHIQNLNLADSAVENSVCSGVADRLVAGNHTGIISRVRGIRGNVGQDALLKRIDFIAKQGRCVDIGNGRINV